MGATFFRKFSKFNTAISYIEYIRNGHLAFLNNFVLKPNEKCNSKKIGSKKTSLY